MRRKPKHIRSEGKVLGLMCAGEPLYRNAVTGSVCIGDSKNIVHRRTVISLEQKGFIDIPAVYALTSAGRQHYEQVAGAVSGNNSDTTAQASVSS